MDQEKKRSKLQNIPETHNWILCDSKSKPGRKYYYNPFTKQTLWHHSDEEIKKKLEKIVGVANSQPHDTKLDENLDMPIKPEDASIYEHNTITKNMASSNPINIWDIPFIQPTVPFIPQVLPSAFINTPVLCNQIITPPMQTAFVNIQSGAINTANQMQTINRLTPNVDTNSYESGQSVKTVYKKSNNTIKNATDLRNKLRNQGFEQHHTHNKGKKEMIENVSWSEEEVKSILLYLKGYAPLGTKSHCWYIVPDTGVVMKHSRLLNHMTVLDDKRCRLKIPPSVRKRVIHFGKKNADETICRFVRFHCTETDSEVKVWNTRDTFFNIVKTCQDLAMDNYHVVLLCTTDKIFTSYKKLLNTPVFTVKKIRELLTEGRLIPRSSTLLPDSIPTQNSSGGTKDDEQMSENSLNLNMENTSGLSLFVINKNSKGDEENNTEKSFNNISTESERLTMNQRFKKLQVGNEIFEHKVYLSKHDATSLEMKEKSSPTNNNINSNISTKKRTIRLKPACEENSISYSTKKKRWSGIRKLNQKRNTTILSTTDNISENENNTLREKTNVENDHPLVESHKEQNDNSDVFSSSEPTVSIVEKNTSNVNPEKIESHYKNEPKLLHFKPKCGIFIDCVCKIDFENLIQINRWIPKFMQIMENLFIGVLGQETYNSWLAGQELSQLQRLHKAALEIIKNFNHCWLVVDAANKLSMKITQSCGSEGAIKLDQIFFQDLYIYGVNLVHALQEISSIEDIQNAKQLLASIREEMSIVIEDSSQNTSTDHVSQLSPGVPKDEIPLYIEENNVSDKQPNNEGGSIEESSSTSKSKHNSEHDVYPPNNRNSDMVDNQESVYFTALNLRKLDKEQVAEDADITDIHESETNLVPPISKTNSRNNSLLDDSKEELQDTMGNYSHGEIQETINDYTTECDDISYSEANVFQDIQDVDQSTSTLTTNELNNEQFKSFIGMILKEIREAFVVCTHVIKNDLRDKFGPVHTLLYNIKMTLDSILLRETDGVDNNCKSVLKNGGFDVNFDQDLCDEYRDIILKCRNAVNAYLKILDGKVFNQNCGVSADADALTVLTSL